MERIDVHFKRNTAGISLVELFWGMGIPLIMESAFIQIFLHQLGASGLVIGAIPAILFIGQAAAGIFSSYFSGGGTDRRKVLMWYHMVPSAIIFLYSFILFFIGFNKASVSLFLIYYSLLCFGFGLILPLWQNYTVVIFSRHKVVKALSIMRFIQTVGKLAGSLILSIVIKNLDITAYSTALVYGACSLLFAGSTFFFFLTRDDSEDSAPGIGEQSGKGAGFFDYLRGTLGQILKNRDFLLFLGSDLEFLVTVSLVSFYAAYGLDYAGFSSSLAAGGLMAANISGQLLSNLLMGLKKGTGLRRQAWIAKTGTGAAILLLILWPAVPGVLLAGALLGYSRGVRGILFPPAVRQLSLQGEATVYYALAPIITLPAAGGLPLLSGFLLDLFSVHGIGAYRILFGFLGVFTILSGVFLKKSKLQ